MGRGLSRHESWSAGEAQPARLDHPDPDRTTVRADLLGAEPQLGFQSLVPVNVVEGEEIAGLPATGWWL